MDGLTLAFREPLIVDGRTLPIAALPMLGMFTDAELQALESQLQQMAICLLEANIKQQLLTFLYQYAEQKVDETLAQAEFFRVLSLAPLDEGETEDASALRTQYIDAMYQRLQRAAQALLATEER